MIAPPKPPSHDPLEALIREARSRQRRRWMVAAAIVAVLAGGSVAAWAATPGGGDSFVIRGRGPVSRVTGYVSSVSALSRRGIEYVGSSGGVTWAANGHGIWLTTNGGRSWRHSIGGGVPNVQFVDKQHGWMAVAEGVDRTSDGGRTWHTTTLPCFRFQTCTGTSVSFLDARHGYALTGDSEVNWLFRTSDGGRTWQLVSRPAIGGPIQFVNARLGFAGDGPLQPDGYVGPPIENPLYRTTDGGVTWSTYDVGGSDGWVEEPIGVFGSRFVLAQNVPNHGDGINENLGTVWVSSDAGAHWLGRHVPAIFPYSGFPPSALSIASPRDLAVASDVGADLYVTSDSGARWRDISLRGLPADHEITQVAFTSSEVGWAVIYVSQGLDGTLFRTTDGGRHWTPAGPLKPKMHKHG